jgi:hypothetical protein
MLKRLDDLAGRTFGRLSVVARAATVKGRPRWECVCDCGKLVSVDANNLKSGKQVSCGCYRREKVLYQPKNGQLPRIIGAPRTPAYFSWIAMVRRTTEPSCSSWKNYGGRGIRVCARWLNGEGDLSGFQCFLLDMGERPKDLSIDRVDNDGNYEPGNCRWATAKEQANNKRAGNPCEGDVARPMA